jgi:hypothetical protein
MRRRRLLLAVLPALLLLAATAATAQITAATPPGPIYRLTPDSAFEDGCFDPCLCPVHFYDRLAGTMRLVPAAPEPGFVVHEVRDVNWIVPGLDWWVTGSGTYRLGGQPLMQRLELDLKVDGRDVQHFDSGLVFTDGAQAGIAITISMNNMVCHDTVFHLVARPIVMQEIVPYTLYRSQYEEGCFGLCDCLVSARPLTGRFGLLKLADGETGADFAVLNFKGLVREPATTATDTGWPVEGVGIYRVGAPARDERLRLALREDGRGVTRFDSGTIPGDGDLKRIDIDVAADGFACYDRVYSIHARRRPPAVMTFQMIAPDPAPWAVAPAP